MDALDPQVGGTIAFSNYYSLIYEPLLPEALCRMLKEAKPDNEGDPPPVLRLHIDPSLDWIPWEVAHDGDEFLGLRFQIARLPIVGLDKEAPPPEQPRRVEKIYNFLGEFVLDAALVPGWQKTFTVNGAQGVDESRFPTDVDPLRFPRVRDVEVAAADASIVHFTCHGGLKDTGTEGGSFWTLNHKQPTNPQFRIHAHVVRALKTKMPKRQPLIFGNACGSSGAAAGVGGLDNSFRSLFVQSGASANVGTFAPVDKARAIEFAQEFYKRLFDSGEPIGTALWRAKQLCCARTPADPSPLFYCHFGMPTTRYILGN
jgi:CHAT domain-containing protein